MDNTVETEFSILLEKYAGGNIPPLVDIDNPKLGLIDNTILEKYLRGTMVKDSLPLGILLAAEWFDTMENKWLWGDFRLNDWAKSHWPNYCRAIRESTEGNQICENCDRHRALLAENKKRAIAYLCNNGLIDFAVPVTVNEQVIATLFSGQYRPKKGAKWNPEFIQPDGIFVNRMQSRNGVDAWNESQMRMQVLSKHIGMPKNFLTEILADEKNPVNYHRQRRWL